MTEFVPVTDEAAIQSEERQASAAAFAELADLMAQTKKIARRYYELTNKPLGVTGEIAEYEAARLLGLQLTPAREPGHDALSTRGPRTERLQIKGRAVDVARRYVGRVPRITMEPRFEAALLVLLDRKTMEAIEIWRAEYADIKRRLVEPGSKARNERMSLGISQFRSIAKLIWST